MMREFWLRIHRYAGLAMAAFLIIAGLTGSIIAFQSEIDAWLNPHLFHSIDRTDRLPLAELIARAERADPRLHVTYIEPAPEPGVSALLYGSPLKNPQNGEPFEIDYDHVFMDPASGDVLGRRLWGEYCFERQNLVPFLFKLHYSLHVSGSRGMWFMGAIAFIWVLDCFVGAYLTLPRQAPLLPKWKRAWQVRTHAGAARLNFDLHRAGGLWVWGLLLVLAVSSVSLNLRKEVFEQVVGLFSPVTSPIYDRSAAEKPIDPAISFDDAERLGRAEAARQGWGSRVERIYYSPEQGFYGVRVSNARAAARVKCLGSARVPDPCADQRATERVEAYDESSEVECRNGEWHARL